MKTVPHRDSEERGPSHNAPPSNMQDKNSAEENTTRICTIRLIAGGAALTRILVISMTVVVAILTVLTFSIIWICSAVLYESLTYSMETQKAETFLDG